MPKRANPSAPAFTLTELLIVITIMILLMAVAVPNVRLIVQQGREKSALSSAKAAAAAARSYAGQSPPFSVGSYQGCAILFTPANELRIVQHFEAALDGSGVKLVTKTPPQAGYKDTGDRYITTAEGVGFVGISRNAAGAPLLLAPPFAVRFDRNGQLMVRMPNSTVANSAVYYDGNFNNQYTSASRTTGPPQPYNPGLYDPESPGFLPANKVTAGFVLGFEEIEMVAGVIAFSKNQLADASNQFAAAYQGPDKYLTASGAGGGINSEARDWILATGTPIFFNRYTGDAVER